MTRCVFAVVVAAGSLVAAGTAAPTPAADQNLHATVGPGHAITLEQGGKRVKTLKAGRYLVIVTDRSKVDDFRLKGGGFNGRLSGVKFRGTKRIVIKLERGTYTYLCDRHPSRMRGSFRVV